MVIIVIAFAPRDQRQPKIVACGIFVGIGLFAPHVRQRINKEGEVMAEHQTQQTAQQQHAPHIAHRQTQRQRKANIG